MNKNSMTASEYLEFIKKKKSISPKKNGDGSKAKAEIEMVLKHGGYNYVKELKFHPSRKWRFDFAIESLKIAIEYEGIMSEKSRHTTITGWKVLRFTAINYKNLASILMEYQI